MERYRDRIQRLMAQPVPCTVVWMATRRCNLSCRYCVLPREESPGPDLSTDEVMRAFASIAEEWDPARIVVGITGGEATLRPDLVEIVRFLVKLGFRSVGVDSNGILYGKEPVLFDRLVEAGMRGPTISVDGTGEGQRVLRGDRSEGRWSFKALEHAQRRYPTLGTTAICAAAPENLYEVPAVMERFEDLGLRFARISPIFPLGRAAAPGRVLPWADRSRLCAWLAEQRALFVSGKRDLEIELVDDGWCGLAWEGGLLRAGFLYCEAGLTVLGIEHDGRVVGCPVIHASFNVQGDVHSDRLPRLWRERFRPFRDRGWLKKGACSSCTEWDCCLGGSMHNHADDGTLLDCPALHLEQQMRER